MRELQASNSGRRARRLAAAGLAALALVFGARVVQAQDQAVTPPAPEVKAPAPEVKALAPEVKAPDLEVKTTGSQPPPGSELEVQDGVTVLTLQQATEIALRQNLGLVVQRYVRAQSAMRVYQELGIYDLLARANAGVIDRQLAITNQSQAPRTRGQSLDVGATQNLPTGGRFLLDWSNSRTQSNSSLNLTDLFYTSDLTVTYDQPLLRNFGRLATESQLLVAKTNDEISRQEFERQVTVTLQEVDTAYWNLVEALEQEQVAEESLKLAKDLDQRNRIQVEVGTLAPLELVQSEAQIATREEDIIRAQAQVGDSADQLRRLLNLPAGPMWERPLRATTDPRTEHITIDVDGAVTTAFSERPELRQQELAIENAKIGQAFARNQLLPQLDLEVTYGANGTGDAFPGSFRQVRGVDFPTWTAGLVFSYPLQNRAARATKVIADLDLDRTRTELDQLETVVRTEVRTAARGVVTAAKQIDAAHSSSVLQERNLDAERKRYENGLSTSFQITRIQDDLTQARSREVSAIVQYRRALTEYYRATGKLLEDRGVKLIDEVPKINRFSFSPGIETYGR